ncbi:hypothetical protein KC19_1G298200 [Ceratodon purpureus]|uniref:Uncharacterized protein n=1 Tax=Ceratodon purpureus TaxID=3225 RepID=A0A8T0JDC0_CERPU|nr:hypothetical protein KC19_1G298200 [Ceratodon purpureus]
MKQLTLIRLQKKKKLAEHRLDVIPEHAPQNAPNPTDTTRALKNALKTAAAEVRDAAPGCEWKRSLCGSEAGDHGRGICSCHARSSSAPRTTRAAQILRRSFFSSPRTPK